MGKVQPALLPRPHCERGVLSLRGMFGWVAAARYAHPCTMTPHITHGLPAGQKKLLVTLFTAPQSGQDTASEPFGTPNVLWHL